VTFYHLSNGCVPNIRKINVKNVTRIKNVKKRFYIYASMPRFIVIDWF